MIIYLAPISLVCWIDWQHWTRKSLLCEVLLNLKVILFVAESRGKGHL